MGGGLDHKIGMSIQQTTRYTQKRKRKNGVKLQHEMSEIKEMLIAHYSEQVTPNNAVVT